MNIAKSMMLAAMAALSIGTGTAMADGSDVINDYQAAKIWAARKAQLEQAQAGASDRSPTGSDFQLGPLHGTPYRPNGLIGQRGGN